MPFHEQRIYWSLTIVGKRNTTKWTVANLLTCSRIMLAITLLFFPTFSPGFYIVYIAGGITDMIDGTVARRTNTESEFGSKLDSVADIIFVVSALVKIVPELDIPTWLWMWVCIIAAIKIVSMIYGFAKNRTMVSDHSVLNKITGFLVFLLPLTVPFFDLLFTAATVCAVATVAAITESYHVFSEGPKIQTVR